MTCQDCKFYVQHYFKRGRSYAKAFCGHCAHPRLKERKPNNPACDRFKELPHTTKSSTTEAPSRQSLMPAPSETV